MAVGIEHRNQNQNDVLQDVRRGGVGRRRQPVQQLVGGLSGTDFRGVDAASDGEHGFVLSRDSVRVFRR